MKWLQIVALQKFSRENAIVFCLCLAAKPLAFLVFLANLTPFIIMEDRTKTIQHVNQVLIENFAADIDFMSSVHF